MKFRSRLLASYVVLIALPLLLLSFIYYRNSLSSMRDQAQNNVLEIVKKSNEVMDTKLRKVDQGSLALFVDRDLFRIFNQLNPSVPSELLNADRQVSAILSKYFTQNEDVYTYQLWTSYYSFGSQRNLPQGDPTRTALYQEAERAHGKMVWYPTYDFVQMFDQPWLQNSDIEYRYMFSATRLMEFSYVDNSTIARLRPNVERPVLTIGFKADFFNSQFEQSIPTGSSYLVIDPDNKVVASSSASQVTQVFNEQWVNAIRKAGSGTQRLVLDGQKTILCFDRSAVTGWLSVVLIPESTLVRGFIPTIRTSTILLAALLALIAYLFAYFIVRKMTGPIRQLFTAMRSVGEGDFQTRVEVKTHDEFGVLLQRFNRMNSRIETLVKENYEIRIKEKEAEIMALNMQMNPHFLYNTLNIMNWMAIESGQRELNRMLVRLSNMLHYTSRKDWGAVTVAEELEWMKDYFYIMEARFESKFTVHFGIAPELLDTPVPRLLFQPFVENAILHGFEQMEEGGRIEVTGKIKDGTRVLEVSDNGRGMSRETIQRILYAESASIGIKNTISRIRLAYGDEYGIDIESAVGQGTRVIITLPHFSNQNPPFQK